MPEIVVLCGGARAPRRAPKVLSLSLAGADTNVTLRLEDIGRRMVATLSNVCVDLLEIASYVYCADQLVSRGGPTSRNLGTEWRRDLRFIIPVREPDHWSSPEVRGGLERLLAFMSDESMRFDFVGAEDPPASHSYFDFGGDEQQSDAADEIVLFSGGLDSLTGAVERLSRGSSRLLLVSHKSSTKIAHRQRHLAQELARRFPKRVLHVPVQVTLDGIEAVETTQRSRTFLFGALAAVVARIAGADQLSVFENGIVSVNFPVATQIVGSSATRTTHPRVVRDLAEFLSTLLDDDMNVNNPYLWKTKAEVAGLLRDYGHVDLTQHTVSCSRVYWMTRIHTHCGRCSQCLDRRFGTLAAGLGEDDPAAMYEIDLLTGAREDDLDKTMAESFVRHALELQDVTERGFMGRFGGEVARIVSCVPGMAAGDVARAVLDLHHRHAAAVRSVLEDGYRQHASELASQTLPVSCILRLVAGAGEIVRLRTAVPPDTLEPTLADDRNFSRSLQIRIALNSTRHQVLIQGMTPIEGPTSFALLETLVATYENDRQKKLAPENYTFLSVKHLAKALDITITSLRRCIHRIRQRIAEAFVRDAGLPLSANALIENYRWKGYRLNPAVLVLSSQELGAPSARHASSHTTSRPGNPSLNKTTS